MQYVEQKPGKLMLHFIKFLVTEFSSKSSSIKKPVKIVNNLKVVEKATKQYENLFLVENPFNDNEVMSLLSSNINPQSKNQGQNDQLKQLEEYLLEKLEVYHDELHQKVILRAEKTQKEEIYDDNGDDNSQYGLNYTSPKKPKSLERYQQKRISSANQVKRFNLHD